jgi:hypothetical protein
MPYYTKPDVFEHECEYTAWLSNGWSVEAGKKYFVSIQAVFEAGSTFTDWGWLNSEASSGAAAVRSENALDWSALAWPGDHRLNGAPMDLAFEVWTESVATPVPTDSPTPSPSPSPSPVQPDWFTLSLSTTGGGVVSANPRQDSYAPGSVVKINAKSEGGVQFVNWSGDVPAGKETTNPLELTVNTNKSLTAHFEPATWTLEATADHGTVARNPSLSAYPDGMTVQLTAEFEPGFVFDGWISEKGPIPPGETWSNPLTLVMEQNMVLRARSRATTDVWVVW